MSRIDLNADLGEGYGRWSVGDDAALMEVVTSANIACGLHAGDPDVMDATMRAAQARGIGIGAHPGFPDLQGFGRRHIDMGHEEIIDSVIYQVGALKGFADCSGVLLQHLKLHGALYHYALGEEQLFLDIVENVRKAFGDMIFLTLGTALSAELRSRCRRSGVKIALEAFPDRAYGDDGMLLPRTEPGAVIKDPEAIARRAIAMVKGRCVESAGGRRIDLAIDTICIHGDNRESVMAAPIIRRLAASEGIEVRPLGSFV